MDQFQKDLRELAKKLELSSKKVKGAIVLALNNTIKGFSQRVTLEASKESKIQLDLLRSRALTIEANLKNMECTFSIISASIPAILAQARQNQFGVVTTVENFKSAFIIDSKRKRQSKRVMERTSKKRYPIKEVRIDVSDDIKRALKKEAKKLDDILLNNITRELERVA